MFPSKPLFLILLLGLFLPLRQGENGFTSPAPGDTISGTVTVTGTAVHPEYLRYELAFRQLDVPGADWIVFAEGDQPVVNGTLAVWDTTVGRAIGAPVFPDGRYQLRLRVVKTDYNYDEFFLTELVIQNDGPTPPPTPDEAALALTATAVLNDTAAVDSDSAFQPATPLPSLTPFPTLTPQPTPLGNLPAETAVPEAPTGGLLGRLGNASWDRVGSGFMLGVMGTAVLFGFGILYLLLRAVGRRLWRTYWHQQNRRGERFE